MVKMHMKAEFRRSPTTPYYHSVIDRFDY